MVNSRLIYKIIGSLLFLLTLLMSVCALMSLYFGENDMMPFLISTLLTGGGGFVFKYLGRDADNNLSRRDAYLVVTLSWVVFSFFGMQPFLIGGYINSVTDAFFETLSGFTTTGATLIDRVEALPHGILFWRSLTQWIGGLGIVFFTIAVLPSMVGGSVKVFAAEATGPMRSKMHPRLSTSAKWIWSIYLALTVACLLSFFAAGMDWFDSINYSMTTTATGGFATHDDNTFFFHSASIEYVAILYQFLGGINLTVLYLVLFKGRLTALLRNSEFRLYIAIILLASATITALLMTHNAYPMEKAVRSALFQVVSFITTTGLFNDDAALWPHLTWVILGFCMLIGACSGSTTGGFKCVRIVMLLKLLRNEFRHILHPNAVLPVKVNGQPVSPSKLTTLTAFLTLFVVMCLVGATAMLIAGVDITNAITISVSCITNAGPSLTQIGPEMSWSDIPDYAKWICCFLMLVGRLEMMSVLVLFTRAFWKDN